MTDNPNFIVPDRPPGDSSNAAANTRFVMQNGGGGSTPGGLDQQVQYNNAGNFAGLTDAQLTDRIDLFSTATTTSGAVPGSNGGGTSNFLRADGTWAAPGGAGGGTVTSIAAGAGLAAAPGTPITGSGTLSLAPIAATSVLGNTAGAPAVPAALTPAQLTTLVNPFSSTLKGAAPASGGGTANFLRADGTWAAPAGSGTVTSISASTGIAVSPSPITGAGSVALANVGNNTVLGNVSGGSAAPIPLNTAQHTTLVDVFTTSAKGAAPASGGGTVNFLRADGSWAVPASGPATTPGGSNLQVQFNNAGSFGGYTNVQLTALIQPFTTSLSGAAPASGGGTTNFLRADGTWAAPVPPAGANPSAQVGTTATNGVATTFMRSDAAPALKQTLGSGTYAFTANYGPMNSLVGTIQLQVMGSVGSPTTDPTAVFMVQKNSQVTGLTGTSNPNPAAYFSFTKNTNGADRGCAVFAEAQDFAGSASGFIEGIRTHAVLSGGTNGEAYGIVATASSLAGGYTELICMEAQLFQQSGTNAPATFNGTAPPTLSVGYITENDGANFADCAFLCNPYSIGKFRRGFVVGANVVTEAAFADYAAVSVGLDLASGSQSFASITTPNNTPIRMRDPGGVNLNNVMFLSTINTLVLGTDCSAVNTIIQSGTTSTPTIVNGLNSNIVVTTSRIKVVTPTLPFSIGGFDSLPTEDGQRIYLFNNTLQTMTIVNEDASSAASNRIVTLTGGNVVLRAGGRSFATFSYDTNAAGLGARWILESFN